MTKTSFIVVALGISTLAMGQATTQPSGPATRPAGKPMSAGQMLDRMLKPTGSGAQPLKPVAQGSGVDATSGRAAVAPDAPTLNLIREGTYLVDRVGRLSRSGDGQQVEFIFESDGRAMQDPPVVILPNLWLMAMEDAATTTSRDLRFRITGMVTEYRSRNYILLEKVVVVPEEAAK